MINLKECLTDDTPIYILSGREPQFNLFHKKVEKVYVKDFNPVEFIGEELCLLKKMRCPHYFLAGVGMHNHNSFMAYQDAQKNVFGIGVASFDFHKPEFQYKSISDYGFCQYENGIFEGMLEKANGKENREQLCDDMLQLLALDLYMGQTDRFGYNFQFEEDNHHNIRLAPIYDFQYSSLDFHEVLFH